MPDPQEEDMPVAPADAEKRPEAPADAEERPAAPADADAPPPPPTECGRGGLPHSRRDPPASLLRVAS